jgi:hypothetical protein
MRIYFQIHEVRRDMVKNDFRQTYSVSTVVERNTNPGEFPRRYYFVLEPANNPQQQAQRIEVSVEMYQTILDQGYDSGSARMSVTLSPTRGRIEMIIELLKDKKTRRR